VAGIGRNEALNIGFGKSGKLKWVGVGKCTFTNGLVCD